MNDDFFFFLEGFEQKKRKRERNRSNWIFFFFENQGKSKCVK
jgi:hypothetical protein